MPNEGEVWSVMDRRGAAAKALVMAAHRLPFEDMVLVAKTLTRAAEGNLTAMEKRALRVLRIDLKKALPPKRSNELGLWKVCAEGGRLTMPRCVFFPRGLTPEGLGRTQEWIPVTDFPDSWDNHPDHPNNPANK